MTPNHNKQMLYYNVKEKKYNNYREHPTVKITLDTNIYEQMNKGITSPHHF